ncbi:hypothetical protein ElyMa_006316500 [Elysia marginata]|uniref:Uncharacterized protein n=1 Tax=Elysia marginata TaxID=1093978 RepID=A0AAV4HK67_9GAST|nr:hypothetical protein ElyMa_006316500 [Elysia marginata]
MRKDGKRDGEKEEERGRKKEIFIFCVHKKRHLLINFPALPKRCLLRSGDIHETRCLDSGHRKALLVTFSLIFLKVKPAKILPNIALRKGSKSTKKISQVAGGKPRPGPWSPLKLMRRSDVVDLDSISRWSQRHWPLRSGTPQGNLGQCGLDMDGSVGKSQQGEAVFGCSSWIVNHHELFGQRERGVSECTTTRL